MSRFWKFVSVFFGVVLVILLFWPRFCGWRNPATEKQLVQLQLQQFHAALVFLKHDLGGLPSEQAGLTALLIKPAGEVGRNWAGPYVKKARLPNDLWGGVFRYRLCETNVAMVYSCGPDSQCGNGDDLYEIVAMRDGAHDESLCPLPVPRAG